MTKVLVTGASGGLGLEMCSQFKARGDSVIAVCRKASAPLQALGVFKVIEGVDTASDACVEVLQKALSEESKLDIVVNNAGGLASPPGVKFEGLFPSMQLEATLADLTQMRDAFELNTLGPMRVSSATLPLMHEGSKLIIISTMMGSISDNTSGGLYPYRTAKAAVNMVGVGFAQDLKKKGIAVGLVHPGMLHTNFTPEDTPEDFIKRMRSVESGALGCLQAIDAVTLENSGSFVHGNYGDGLKPCPW
mmetsp:Transcript_6721/g.22338  ORF Transcript_6721/g.22338 Transcript_6721/m.22338 type:complete len:248 (-) Transcript_6721:142-885(-)